MHPHRLYAILLTTKQIVFSDFTEYFEDIVRTYEGGLQCSIRVRQQGRGAGMTDSDHMEN